MIANHRIIKHGGSFVPPPEIESGVQFIDHEGKLWYTWEASTVADKTELPENPPHDGLVAQGWNWTLSQIKSYMVNHPEALMTVGQMYTTDDGRTRVYINLGDYRLSPYLGLCVNGEVDIDWGDGSSHDTVTGTSTSTVVNTQHTYERGGMYVISIGINSGTFWFGGASGTGSKLLWSNDATANKNMVYQASIYKIETGSGTVRTNQYSFKNLYMLNSISVSNTFAYMGSGYQGNTDVFTNCYSLAAVIAPTSSIRGCTLSSLHRLQFYSINPHSEYNLGKLSSLNALKSIAIPDEITAFPDNCQSFSSLISCTLPTGTKNVPGGCLLSSYSLKHFRINQDTTGLGSYFLCESYSLESIVIPPKITTIGGDSFRNCYALKQIKFESTTPPTFANSNVFGNISADCKILVPRGSIEAYTTATNYPSPAIYTYEEYDL